MRIKYRVFTSFLVTGLICFSVVAQTRVPVIRYLSFSEGKLVVAAVPEGAPQELVTAVDSNASSVWDAWIRGADKKIRERLEQGDEDSIVNLLLFGTSFTKQPRMTESQMKQLAQEKAIDPGDLYLTVLKGRVDDFALALASPKANERLRFARSHLIKKLNIKIETTVGKDAVKLFLRESLRRVLSETEGFAALLKQARANQEDEFVLRSKLYSRRGLSSDTSLKPNFAIENAIAQLKEKGILNNIRRVAIIGPGLDFTDKDDGYDFYPPQTLQPFAVIESLLKLGLSDTGSLQVDTFDLSPKVNSHIASFATKAKLRQDYLIQLPLSSDQNFSPEFINYWNGFGAMIAVRSGNNKSIGLPGLQTREVTIRSEFLKKIRAFDTNIVLQSPVLRENERYDLIIGTNIFLYYDTFEQGLAMQNLEKMLKDGGVLLSNNALIEFPFTPIHSIGYSKAIYSQRKNDADAIVWYQKKK